MLDVSEDGSPCSGSSKSKSVGSARQSRFSPALASVHVTVKALLLPNSRLSSPSRMSSLASTAPQAAAVLKSTVATEPCGVPPYVTVRLAAVNSPATEAPVNTYPGGAHSVY